MCQHCSMLKLWHAKCYSENVQEVQCQGGKRIDGKNSGVDSHPSTNSTTPSLEVKISGSCDQSEAAAKTSEDHPAVTKCQVLSPELLIVSSPIGSIEPRLFFNIQLNGMKLLALLDNGAGCSYLGKGLNAKFAGKLEPLSSSAHIADGSAVPVQGLLNVEITLDDMKHSMPFRVSDDLQYECILGIHFKRRFKLKIDYENDTWWTPKGIIRQFYPYGHDPTIFPALASVGGLSRATVDQQLKIEEGKKILIPPTAATLGWTNIDQYGADSRCAPEIFAEDAEGSVG